MYNGNIIKKKYLRSFWIQPASGDAGSSIGAALICLSSIFEKPRLINPNDSMKGAYLGPIFLMKK